MMHYQSPSALQTVIYYAHQQQHHLTYPTYHQEQTHVSCLIMPTVANNLLSMGVFCDAGCTVTFTKDFALIHNSAGMLIMRAARETGGARMWRFHLIKPNVPNASTLTPTNVPTIIPPDYDEDDDYAPTHITKSPTIAINIPPTSTSTTTTTPT
jgi:hypothetical protein